MTIDPVMAARIGDGRRPTSAIIGGMRIADFALERLLRPLGVRRRPPAVRLGRRGLPDGRAARPGRRRDARDVGRPPPRLHRVDRTSAPAPARSPRSTTGSSRTRSSCSPAPRRRIFCLANVLLGPGDHAIVTWPGYQSLYEVARAAGADVTPARAARGRRLVDRCRAARVRVVRPSTRLVVVNAPHNPTGMLPTARRVARADEPVRRRRGPPPRRRGLPLPRVRRRRTGCRPAPRRSTGGSRSASCRSRSRWPACGSAGWRPTIERCSPAARAFKDYTTICSSAPSEILALIGAPGPRRRPGPVACDRRREPAAARSLLRATAPTGSRGSDRGPARSASRGSPRPA